MQLFAAAHDAAVPLFEPMNLFVFGAGLVTTAAFVVLVGVVVLTVIGRAD